MNAMVIKLRDKQQTAGKMYDIVRKTSGDINGFSKMPLIDYYDMVKNIPYRQDPRPREIIARPKFLFRHKNAGLDCKKKSLLIAAWAKQNKIPFRFVASSRLPTRKIHHVFPELYISGRFIPVDATYPHNRINQRKNYTKYQILAGG